MTIIKKEAKSARSPARRALDDAGIDNEFSKKDKLDLLKKMYKQAKVAEPQYTDLESEIMDYSLTLPSTFETLTLKESHKLFSILQSYLGRLTEIESTANGNQSRWDRLTKLMKAYLEESGSEILLSDECMEFPNAKMQDAFVRKKLKKFYTYQTTFSDKLGRANAFVKNVEGRRKYLNSSYQSLSRQVSILEAELRTLEH